MSLALKFIVLLVDYSAHCKPAHITVWTVISLSHFSSSLTIHLVTSDFCLSFFTVPLHGQPFACACRPLTNRKAASKVDNFQAASWLVNGRQAQAKGCSCRGPVSGECSDKFLFRFQLNFKGGFEVMLNVFTFYKSQGIERQLVLI